MHQWGIRRVHRHPLEILRTRSPPSYAPPIGSSGAAPRTAPRPGVGASASATSARGAARGRSSARRRDTGKRGSPVSASTAPHPTGRVCRCFRIISPATTRVSRPGWPGPAHRVPGRRRSFCRSSRGFAIASSAWTKMARKPRSTLASSQTRSLH